MHNWQLLMNSALNYLLKGDYEPRFCFITFLCYIKILSHQNAELIDLKSDYVVLIKQCTMILHQPIQDSILKDLFGALLGI